MRLVDSIRLRAGDLWYMVRVAIVPGGTSDAEQATEGKAHSPLPVLRTVASVRWVPRSAGRRPAEMPTVWASECTQRHYTVSCLFPHLLRRSLTMTGETFRTEEGIEHLIIDELCHCGHRKSVHRNQHTTEHGTCIRCSCVQFTWAGFIAVPTEEE